MKRTIAALIVTGAGLVLAAQAQPTLTGVSMFGATNASGAWNGNFDYWDTVGGDFAYNVYLFTGSIASPVYLNSGDSSVSLNPGVVLSPGTYVIQYACDFNGWDPGTPFLGMNLFFNNDQVTNRISAVVPNSGSHNYAVISNTVMTYTQGTSNFGSGFLSYTVSNLVITLSDFNTVTNTPSLVSGYNNVPSVAQDFTGSFTLTVAPVVTNFSILPAVQLGWTSTTNVQYQVQWSTNVNGSNWFNLGTPVPGTGTNIYLFDAVSGNPRRFYRLNVVP